MLNVLSRSCEKRDYCFISHIILHFVLFAMGLEGLQMLTGLLISVSLDVKKSVSFLICRKSHNSFTLSSIWQAVLAYHYRNLHTCFSCAPKLFLSPGNEAFPKVLICETLQNFDFLELEEPSRDPKNELLRTIIESRTHSSLKSCEFHAKK